MPNLPNIKPDAKPEDIAKTYSDYLGLPITSLKNKIISKDVIKLIPQDLAQDYKIVAHGLTSGHPQTLKIGVADPAKLSQKAPSLIIDLKKKKGYNIALSIITPDDFESAQKFYKDLIPVQKEVKKDENIDDQQSIKLNTNNGDLKVISLINKYIPYEILNKFPKDVAQKYKMVVFEAPGGSGLIKVAMADPDNNHVKEIISFIEKRNNVKVEKYQTTEKDIDYALKLYEQAMSTPISRPIQEKTASIPLAKPLPMDKIKTDNLPPLKKPEEPQIKITNSQKLTDKPKIIESRNIASVEMHESEYKPFISEEAEKNLDSILPAGVRNQEELAKIIEGGMIPKIVAAIVYLAVEMEASDIHLEPTNLDFRLRYRIDGILKDILKMPLTLHLPLISRIKILSKLKIDEQRVPQDGRFDVAVNKKEIDLRVSTLPTVHGEKVVMRILDKSAGVKKIEDLGFAGTNLTRLTENIKKPYGVILATGPTGSGKSTTLYAILNQISNPGVNIVTLEDPVEYEIPGVNQCQIRPKIGFGFAEGLRSILRQDPNIIMVGEIRDSETASMATHAALTGHLVLTTLHTNDAAGALPRLINMGIEPFLITSAINCIISQRLVRKICAHCKIEVKIPAPLLEDIKKDLSTSQNPDVLAYKDKPLKFYKGKGCAYCSNGYKGRIGIYEVLPVSAKIEELAVHKSPSNEILRAAIEEKMITMKQDGIIKALNGITTIDEILRETSSD